MTALYRVILRKNLPEGRFAAKCIYSKIKSAGFAFPGDVSLTLNMTICLFIVILNAVKPPRQVAPSPPRYACHLSRFNGRVYSRKGGLPRSKQPYVKTKKFNNV